LSPNQFFQKYFRRKGIRGYLLKMTSVMYSYPPHLTFQSIVDVFFILDAAGPPNMSFASCVEDLTVAFRELHGRAPKVVQM
jgi:hypothetical protein